MKLSNTQLGIIVGLLSLFVFAVVGLELAGREVDGVLYLGAAVVIPAAMQLVGIKATGEVSRQVKQVKQLTNGNTSRLLDQLEARGVDVSEQREVLRASIETEG